MKINYNIGYHKKVTQLVTPPFIGGGVSSNFLGKLLGKSYSVFVTSYIKQHKKVTGLVVSNFLMSNFFVTFCVLEVHWKTSSIYNIYIDSIFYYELGEPLCISGGTHELCSW